MFESRGTCSHLLEHQFSVQAGLGQARPSTLQAQHGRMKACRLGHVFGSLPERLIRFTTAGGELSIWTVWVDHGYIPCTRRLEQANSVLKDPHIQCSGKILLDTSKTPLQETALRPSLFGKHRTPGCACSTPCSACPIEQEKSPYSGLKLTEKHNQTGQKETSGRRGVHTRCVVRKVPGAICLPAPRQHKGKQDHMCVCVCV